MQDVGLDHSLFGRIHPALVVIIVATSYAILVVTYRLKFHPLAKFPGPWLAKVTDLYPLYHAWNSDRHLTFWRCHEKYGDIVRYGPNTLSINTSTGLKTIYGAKANVKKSSWYRVIPPANGVWSVWTCIDKALHAVKRRAIAHAFSDIALAHVEHFVLCNVQIFCDLLVSQEAEPGKWGAAQNMSDLANWLTFDIVGELAFGNSSFKTLTEPDNRIVIDLIANNAYRCHMCGTLPILHDLGLDKVLFPKLVEDRERYMKFSKDRLLERTNRGSDTDRKDFFHYLLNAKDPETGQGFTMPELWAESNLLIIAGSETPATAMAATFYYLTHNDRTLHKLEKEILYSFQDIDEITSSNPKLASCAYLRACIDEAMRLSPSVTGTVPREVLEGGITIDGHFIPEGTVVGTGFYSIHHNQRYFPEPFRYFPERWIAGSTPEVTPDSVEVAHSGFFPFSYGMRGCIGQNLAYMELRLTLARTIWLYEMRLQPGSTVGDVEAGAEKQRHNEFKLEDRFQAVKDGPMVQFRPRQR